MREMLDCGREEWDYVFVTFCKAHGCPARYYDGLSAAYPGERRSNFNVRAYVRFLAETAATKILYCPEMGDVAGNLLTFYTRRYVSKLNENFYGERRRRQRQHAGRQDTTPPRGSSGGEVVMRSNYKPFERHHDGVKEAVESLERDYVRNDSRGGNGTTCSYPRLYEQGLLTDEFMEAVRTFGGVTAVEELLTAEPHLEYAFDYVAMRTAGEVYMLRSAAAADGGEPLETLAETFLRTALHLHEGKRDRVVRTFNDLIRKRCMFATPVIINSGLRTSSNVSSCFLMGASRMNTAKDLFETLGTVATCLENHGGVGLSLTHYNFERYGGLIGVMKLINESVNVMKHNTTGRPGAVAVYLEPWHPDIADFLDARKNHGDERKRCRDLFTALWVPDVFMKRVHGGGVWSLFDPESDAGRELLTLHGSAFEERYADLETHGRYTSQVSARMLWTKLLKSQIGTGTPYVLYKDSCVGKSVHRRLGPITCSNLCTEVIQFSTTDRIATCKLASVCLPAFFNAKTDGDGDKRQEILHWNEVARTVENLVYSLNRIHDRSKAIAGEETGSASIGIGVQGLADVMFLLNTYWGSCLCKRANKEIFERIYFYAASASCDQARVCNRSFRDSFGSTDTADGVLQFDLWPPSTHTADDNEADGSRGSRALDWTTLKADVVKYGMYNSLLIALMPTATTSQITGYSESFEPLMANVYLKRTGNGEFQVVNRHLVNVLRAKGRYDEETVRRVQRDEGSVRALHDILNEHERRVFRTVWEIAPRVLIDMAADRARFVDQSQSMNIYLADPDVETLSELHFYGWAKGLKTGMYYLRTRPAANAIKFTLMPTASDDNDDDDDNDGCVRGGSSSSGTRHVVTAGDVDFPRCDGCSS